jgi:hypothetical protein
MGLGLGTGTQAPLARFIRLIRPESVVPSARFHTIVNGSCWENGATGIGMGNHGYLIKTELQEHIHLPHIFCFLSLPWTFRYCRCNRECCRSRNPLSRSSHRFLPFPRDQTTAQTPTRPLLAFLRIL